MTEEQNIIADTVTGEIVAFDENISKYALTGSGGNINVIGVTSLTGTNDSSPFTFLQYRDFTVVAPNVIAWNAPSVEVGAEVYNPDDGTNFTVDYSLGNDETIGASQAVAPAVYLQPMGRDGFVEGVGFTKINQLETGIMKVTEDLTYATGTLKYLYSLIPVSDIDVVTGLLSSVAHTFVKDTDYELGTLTDENKIIWLEEDEPDTTTPFRSTYVVP